MTSGMSAEVVYACGKIQQYAYNTLRCTPGPHTNIHADGNGFGKILAVWWQSQESAEHGAVSTRDVSTVECSDTRPWLMIAGDGMTKTRWAVCAHARTHAAQQSSPAVSARGTA